MADLLDQAASVPAPRLLADELLLARALIDQIPDFVFVKSRESRFLVANTAIASAYGFPDREQLLGKTDFDLHAWPNAQAFFEIEQRIMSSGIAVVDMEESFCNSAGQARWYSTTKMPLRDGDHRIVGLIGVARDITERKQMESYRHEQGLLLEMIANNAPLPRVLDRLVEFIESQLDGIKGSILLLDPATGRLLHGAAPSLPDAFCRAIDGLRIGPDVGSCGTAAFRGEEVVVADITIDPLWERYRDLAERFGLRSCWSTPILSHEGKVLGTFGMYSDAVRLPVRAERLLIEVATRIAGIAITRQQSEDRIKFIAHHDALTGLPNRTLLSERLVEAIRQADGCGGRVDVVFIDLDHFKVVNDGLGHGAGDQLLQIIAARMLQQISASDSVIRLGGDEFVVLISGSGAGTERRTATLQAIRTTVSEPIDVGGRHVQITCSMGVATYPEDGTEPDTLLMNADAAMYAAKDAGRDALQFYTAERNEECRERLYLREQMRGAIERGEFALLYQPQVDLRSGRVFAVEALLRWQHPVLGPIMPDKFIAIAEDSGLIVPIGDWVLQTACRQNKAWQDAGHDPIMVSVNVSARQFTERSWVGRVEAALQDSGLDARHLDLEITESMLMHNLQQAIATMRDLKRLGVKLSIDDFGTGYSSLSALKSFPVGRLKIDRSFVRDLSFDENDKAIALAVISMGHQLGLRIIAEGVETEEQLSFLIENDCDEIQGYLYSRPVTASAIPALIAHGLKQPAAVRRDAAGTRRASGAPLRRRPCSDPVWSPAPPTLTPGMT